jgi:hypothetical protein
MKYKLFNVEELAFVQPNATIMMQINDAIVKT